MLGWAMLVSRKVERTTWISGAFRHDRDGYKLTSSLRKGCKSQSLNFDNGLMSDPSGTIDSSVQCVTL